MQSPAWTAIATGFIGVLDRKAIPSLLICVVAFLCMGFTLVLGNRSSQQVVDTIPVSVATSATITTAALETGIGLAEDAPSGTDEGAHAMIAAPDSTHGVNHGPAAPIGEPRQPFTSPGSRVVAPPAPTSPRNESDLMAFPRLVEFTSFMPDPKSRLPLVSIPKTAGIGRLLPRTFQGVGFPHIEMGDGDIKERYKPYTRLMIPATERGSEGPGWLVANVACPGGSVKALVERAERFDAMVLELAIEQTISASLIKAIITVESCFNARARSPSGARGLMQLMPGTARMMGVEDVLNPEQNIRGGIKYLKFLRGQFSSIELALAAYNAGPGNVRRYNGIPPFPETQDYVRRVMHNYHSFAATNRHRASTSVALVSPEQ